MITSKEFSQDGKAFFLFGMIKGFSYGKLCNEKFNDYKKFKNKIPKQKIIEHIKNRGAYFIETRCVRDIFTHKDIGSAGMCVDGDFMFPLDFLHYLKNYDIGVPYEYETYLQSIGIDK